MATGGGAASLTRSREMEEGALDVQLQLKKCGAVDEQHARAIAKIEKDFAQVCRMTTKRNRLRFFIFVCR